MAKKFLVPVELPNIDPAADNQAARKKYVDDLFNSVPAGRGVRYNFSTTTTNADPGNGIFRMNNATIGSVTNIYIDNVDVGGVSMTSWLADWAASTNINKGYIEIKHNSGASSVISIFRVTAVQALSGYYNITVQYVSGTRPNNNDPCVISFMRTGDVGDRGGVRYNFSTTVTNADPGNGIFRFNNATIASVTQIYIDNVDVNTITMTAWFAQWGTPTGTNKGYVTIKSNAPGSTVTSIFRVTGVAALTGYYRIDVVYVSGTAPANNEACVIEFSIAGEQGAAGAPGATGPAGDISAVQSSGTVISFDQYRVYGTDASPISGNLTDSNTDAKLGVTVGIIHQSSSIPTVPATWKRLASSFNYRTNVKNYIYVQYFDNNNKFYSIVQRDADAETVAVSDSEVTLNASPKPSGMTTLANLINVVSHRHASSEGSGPMPIRVMSQSAYNSLSPKDSNTLYFTYD